jgi:3-dehydroquinate dehydratase/shikimate dehydrogenase
MNPLLCVTAAAPTMAALCQARDEAFADGADLVEMRLDHADQPDVEAALAGRGGPVIVTCRAAWEGGRFAGSEEERRRILERAIGAGAEYIDVEAAAPFASSLVAARGGRGIIVSHHQFEAPPREVTAAYRHLRGFGAEIVKLAVAVDRLSDTIPLFDLGKADAEGHVILGMGPAGVPTRALAGRLGNRWTFAGAGVAPGQLPLHRMLHDLQFRRLRPDAALYGVTGKPVGHSRSPAMHNAGFAALDLNSAYLPLEAADAPDLAAFARALAVQGLSITAPYKVTLMPFVDELTDTARRVGAINTIVVGDGRWIGDNTDVEGFLAPLTGVTLRGARACVLGGGGAARAVAVGLADSGAEVMVSARRHEAAREIAGLAAGRAVGFPPPAGSWDILINAIPAGTSAATESPMGGTPLDGRLVYDLVYEPEHTKLLVDARAAGCRTIGGLDMLIAQAERQFELWTGQRPPAGVFSSAARPVADRQPRPDAAQVL